MAILTERKQVGPLTLTALTDLLVEIANAPNREPEFVADIRRKLKDEQEAARRRAIKAAFGDLGGKGPIGWNEGVLLEPPMEDVQFALGPDGSPDSLACYLPWHGRDCRNGIYFIRRTLIETTKRNRNISLPQFFRSIAVHELFHYHTERLVGDDTAYSGHACSPYCRIEEAGANFVAHRYAEADPSSLATFEPILFRKREDGGLRGYGEYHHLDERIVSSIGHLKRGSIGTSCIEPAGFNSRMAEFLTNPGTLDANGEASWAAILDAADSGGIAFYYDMFN